MRPGATADWSCSCATPARVLTQIAKVDGSVGWVVMIGSFASLILGRTPRRLFDHLRGGPDITVAGAAAPGGTAEVFDGGYRVRGVGRSPAV